MNKEKTAYYLKTLHRVLNIPIVYGMMEGGNMQYFQPFSLINENEAQFITGRLQHVFTKFSHTNVMFQTHRSLVMLGIVVNHETKEFVFVGPLAPSAATEEGISDYLFESGLSAETSQKLSDYLSVVKPLTLYGLKELLVNINVVLNDEILSTHEITAIYDEETKSKIAFAKKEFTDRPYDEQQNTVAVEEYTQKLNFCVMNGDLDGLSDLLNDMENIPLQGSDETMGLKELKMLALGSIFAGETLAQKSRSDAAELGRIKQYYLDRIDSSRNPDEIHQLTISALFDYTKHVKDHLEVKTENPTVDRAISFIKANVNSKLLAEDIASALHINLHYLFTKFKAETGKTLTQFINEEKIKKACYYLMFTDKTLIDIAMHFSFSSQSYFQTVFKKIMGITPSEWRENNTYIK